MLKVGLIGSGNIARKRHAPAWQKLTGQASVTAVSDVVEAAANEAAQIFAADGTAPTIYTDYQQLIREADIDAVDICLPHHLHADAILAATAAGKHILCEKPMCIELAEADRIVEAVDQAGIVYMSGHNELFYPAIAGAKELLDRGALGTPYILRSHEFPTGYPASAVPGRPAQGTMMVGWRASRATMGGGVLIDKGYHPTYILLYMAGSEPVEVTAMTNTFVAQMDGEDTALVMVKFANGAIGQIFTGEGFAFPTNDAKFHAIGERGEIYGHRYDLYEKPRGFTESSHRAYPVEPAGNQQSFDATIHHFYDSITTGRRPIQDHRDGQNLIWGKLSAPLREFGRYTFERNMFPGLLALLLSVVGLIVGWRKPLAQYLFLLGVGAAILSLGPNLYVTADNKSILFTRMPYGFLYFHLPGFDSMRVPARMGILFGLSVAGLAAIGLTWLTGKAATWQPTRPRLNGRVVAAALAVVLIAGIGAESLNRPYTPVPLATREEAPPVYRWLATQPDTVVLELPFVIPDHPDQTGMLGDLYQFYALYHGRPVVNGSANVLPKGYKALYYELREGPTPRALSILQGLGVTSLVVHYDELSEEVAANTRELLDGGTTQARSEISFGNDTVYRIAPTDRFAQLRSLIPRDASIYLSRGEDPTGAYGGMLAKILRENPVYTRVRVEFGREYISTLDPNARYDYAILYHYENPADVGFAGATIVWEDEVVRIYGRNAAR